MVPKDIRRGPCASHTFPFKYPQQGRKWTDTPSLRADSPRAKPCKFQFFFFFFNQTLPYKFCLLLHNIACCNRKAVLLFLCKMDIYFVASAVHSTKLSTTPGHTHRSPVREARDPSFIHCNIFFFWKPKSLFGTQEVLRNDGYISSS